LFFIAALASGQPLGLYTAIMGIIFGMFTALCALCGLNAYKFGPVSYTNLITMSSMIIPALSGAIFFGESIGILKIIGIALMLACIFLSVYKSDEGDKRASLRWLLLCLGAALFCVGMLALCHCFLPPIWIKIYGPRPSYGTTGEVITFCPSPGSPR
jgi:drug/metabolite transporter (DMT)-like permease